MQNARLVIIDSGGANLASLQFALERLGQASSISVDHNAIRTAERVILPGVGAARNAMQTLQSHDLDQLVAELTQPVLGICLGMQLLCDKSEEDDVDCLGIIPGTARKLSTTGRLPVPNMGWAPIAAERRHPLLDNLGADAWFYFVHSYALAISPNTIASAEHADRFAAVIAKDNFVATQFHPERSSVAGATLLANFLRWRP
jgi:glutamine amidotransferase